jgi:hypothetical protein
MIKVIVAIVIAVIVLDSSILDNNSGIKPAKLIVRNRSKRIITTTEKALSSICPGKEHLAKYVDAAARTHLHHSITIIAIMKKESNCNMNAIGASGEVCAMQIMPRGPARNKHTPKELKNPKVCITTGARWLALREVKCGGLFLGLSGYNSRTCTGGKKYAKRVMDIIKRIWEGIEK